MMSNQPTSRASDVLPFNYTVLLRTSTFENDILLECAACSKQLRSEFLKLLHRHH